MRSDDPSTSILISTGAGNDEIRLSGNSIEVTIRAGEGDDLIDLTGLFSSTGHGNYLIDGGAGNDRLVGGDDHDDIFGGDGDDLLDGGGNPGRYDLLYGGRGNDLYVVDDFFDVVGEFVGEGVDEVRTSVSSYARLQDFIWVENLTFLGQGDNVGAGNALANRITGNVGNDTFYARGGNDVLMLRHGGNDIVYGEAGKDVFYFGGALTLDDRVDGGSEVDQVVIQGNYTGGAALTLAPLIGIEQLFVLSGADDTYGFGSSALFTYDITTSQETLAPGQILYVNASSLQIGETHNFDGSAETDGGVFYLYGSLGTDLLTGGSGGDVFLFSGVDILNVNDAVNGGGGYDHLLLRGSYEPVRFNATTITNVERVALLSGNDPNMGPILGNLSYHFTLHDANVPAGAEFFLDASNLGVGEWALLDGSGDFDGRVRLIGGAGNDILIGGLGNDTFEGGGGADTLQDGSGDATYVYRAITDSITTYRDRVNGFNAGDRFDMSAMDANANTGANEAFTFIGSGAFTGQAGQLRAFAAPDGLTRIEGDVTGDGIADFAIDVSLGGSNFVFQAGDFLL